MEIHIELLTTQDAQDYFNLKKKIELFLKKWKKTSFMVKKWNLSITFGKAIDSCLKGYLEFPIPTS